MAIANDSDRQKRMVWTILAIVGAALVFVGWYRFAG